MVKEIDLKILTDLTFGGPHVFWNVVCMWALQCLNDWTNLNHIPYSTIHHKPMPDEYKCSSFKNWGPTDEDPKM
jgi:hypothetical protein